MASVDAVKPPGRGVASRKLPPPGIRFFLVDGEPTRAAADRRIARRTAAGAGPDERAQARLPLAAMRISVLDQSPISEGSTGADALRNTIELARLADRLGYHRYWVAEHHGGPMLAGPAPEALIGPIASATEGIRVGSGGVMLPHYSPFKVAETFSLLAGLFPDRIDLGIGRAPGTDPLTTYALQRDRRQASPDDFPNQLVELLAYFDDSLPDDHPFKRLAPNLPGRPHVPEPWLLGSSPDSAIWAGQLALPYAFADFINPDGAGIATSYRNRFAAEHGGDDRGLAPRTAVAIWAVCAETDEEARHLATSRRMTMRLLRQGQLIQVPPPEKAIEWLRAQGLPETGAVPGRRAIVGSPPVVREALERTVEEYGADEAIVVTITYDHEARLRSYELLAEVMELEPRGQGESAGADLTSGARAAL
jgi:luciferase family oxidoreductase group 1